MAGVAGEAEVAEVAGMAATDITENHSNDHQRPAGRLEEARNTESALLPVVSASVADTAA